MKKITIVILSLVVVACSDVTPEPTPDTLSLQQLELNLPELPEITEEDLEKARAIKTLDETFASIAQEMPGFGGYYIQGDNFVVIRSSFSEEDAMFPNDSFYPNLENAIPIMELSKEEVSSILTNIIGDNFLSVSYFNDLGDVQRVHLELTFQDETYDARQMLFWKEMVTADLLSNPMYEVTMVDFEQDTNRIAIGMQDISQEEALRNVVGEMGIPVNVVNVVNFSLIEKQATSSDILETQSSTHTLDSRQRPLQGGYRIYGAGRFCTIGIPTQVTVGSFQIEGFFTNAHCTGSAGIPSVVYSFSQPSAGSGNSVGQEFINPVTTPLHGSNCNINPNTNACRYSDAAFIATGIVQLGNPSIIVPQIATTKAQLSQPHSSVLDVAGQFAYRRKSCSGLQLCEPDSLPNALITKGLQVSMVGQESGHTSGNVIRRDCIDLGSVYNINNERTQLMCQFFTSNPPLIQGDSGSPVYTGDRLVGIMWGGLRNYPNDDGVFVDGSIFSSVDGIKKDFAPFWY